MTAVRGGDAGVSGVYGGLKFTLPYDSPSCLPARARIVQGMQTRAGCLHPHMQPASVPSVILNVKSISNFHGRLTSSPRRRREETETKKKKRKENFTHFGRNHFENSLFFKRMTSAERREESPLVNRHAQPRADRSTLQPPAATDAARGGGKLRRPRQTSARYGFSSCPSAFSVTAAERAVCVSTGGSILQPALIFPSLPSPKERFSVFFFSLFNGRSGRQASESR